MLKPRILTFILASCVVLHFAAGSTPGAEGKKRKKDSEKAKTEQTIESLFKSPVVPQIKIEIPSDAMKALRKYQWNFGPQGERDPVRVTVREGNTTYTDVAMHLKGAAGSFRSIDDNPAMTLHFDKFVEGQLFHGLQKLSLNNSVQDPTYTTELLCRELFLKAGVPVPQVTHAQVELNGRDLGLYILAEGWDKQFLKRHFKNVRGNLYDGGFVKDIDSELATNFGDHKDQSDRIALLNAVKEPDLTNRLARLEKTLDIDEFLTFIALDIMLWDWDGYAQNHNNFRLYHDTDKDRMVFMPHGLDQMFWNPKGPLIPELKGMTAAAVLEIPSLRDRYFARVKELRRTVYDVSAMTNRLQQIAQKIRPTLAKKGKDSTAELDEGINTLSSAIVTRAETIDRQVKTPPAPVKFDSSDSVQLTAWESKPEFGHPTLKKGKSPQNEEILELGTTEGSSIGSWQTTIWLSKGKYRLEGKVKTDGITADPGDPRAGAGVRTGKLRPQKYLVGTSEWKNIDCEFTIKEPLTEVVLLCEFRGAEGHASFDAGSLHLKRLPK